MAFQRALWHSGLNYQQTCPNCRTIVRYTDYDLDFRPWYADGFVDCPTCRAHLRHNERYAINEDGTPYYPPAGPEPKTAGEVARTGSAPGVENGMAYCSNCGHKYRVGTDHFCSRCGKKLD